MTQEQKQLTFPTRAAEELYWAVRQLIKLFTIIIVLSIVVYLTHFFSEILTILLGFIGFILILATFIYTVGHFIRYFVFKSRRQ